MNVLVSQPCPTLCDPMDCSPPGSPVHGILWARMLEWVVIAFSRGSTWPRDWTHFSCLAGRFFINFRGTKCYYWYGASHHAGTWWWKKPDQLLVMVTSVLKFAIEHNIPHNWLYLRMVLPPISLDHSALGPPLYSVFNLRGKKKHPVQVACYGLVASSQKNIYWSPKYFRTWLYLKMETFMR